MNAFRAAAEACAECGAELPDGARFCPDCGMATGAASGATVRAETPSEEAEPAPVSYERPEPRLFGVAPPLPLLAVAVATLVVAVVLFVAGLWPFGLIVLGVGALLLAAFFELVGRRPHSTLTRATFDARARTGSMLETWRVRAEATANARRIHNGLAHVDAERRTALLQLGEAAHRSDGIAEADARSRLDALDRREHELRAELDLRLEDAGERIRKARFAVDETMMVTPNEPYPPPGEATPPQPAVVPEPYPPPDEGTPPAPAPVPEPGPDPGPDR
jgi:zinc-ribbon domain